MNNRQDSKDDAANKLYQAVEIPEEIEADIEGSIKMYSHFWKSAKAIPPDVTTLVNTSVCLMKSALKKI